jgi:hypothetical protein
MQTKDVLKVLEEIDNMQTITEVELDFGEVKISVKRSLVADEPASEPEYPAFEKASTSSALSTPMTNQDPNIATPGQIKFARDLVFKVFGNDERAAIDFLAHSLDLPLAEVPEMNTWESTMTKDMVSMILDRLEPMWKRGR